MATKQEIMDGVYERAIYARIEELNKFLIQVKPKVKGKELKAMISFMQGEVEAGF